MIAEGIPACRQPLRMATLADLPQPKTDGTGWPWTQESSPVPAFLPQRSPWPRVSIVTPSYNQAAFLEETLRSVILQGYPNLEYIVIDGGSEDSSVEMLGEYAPWLAYWESRKDSGQSDAVNRGWARCSGEILAYLNSDDTLLPGALQSVAEAWVNHGRPAAIVGAVQYTDNDSRPTGPPVPARLPGPTPLDLSLVDHEKWLLPQQSGFFSREYLDRAGRWMRPDLHYTLDRELYYRVCRTGPVVILNVPLATYRFHPGSKSISKFVEMYEESVASLAYCNWGGPRERRQRHRIARWRIAQGHRRFAALTPGVARRLWHLVVSTCYRPGYLARIGFYRAIVDAVGLRKPLERLWHSCVKSSPPH